MCKPVNVKLGFYQSNKGLNNLTKTYKILMQEKTKKKLLN